MTIHQVSDESDDDSSPPPRFERYRDFDDLPMDADAGQDNDVEDRKSTRLNSSHSS